jgi:hypothetical protein
MRPSTILHDAVQTTRRIAILVVVPFAVAVLRWNDLVVTGADTTTQFSVTFPTPHSFITLWSFVNAASKTGTEIGTGTLPGPFGLGFGVLFVLTLAVYVVLTGIILAGYLGSINEALTDESFDFVDSVRRYARPLVAYEVLSLVVMLGLVGGVMVIPAFFPVVALSVFVLAYLTYLTPYLVVVTDVGLVPALARSIRLTTHRADPILAFLGFVVFGAVLSVPLSMLVYGNGVVGGLLGAAIMAPIGLFGSVVFVAFTRSVVGGN